MNQANLLINHQLSTQQPDSNHSSCSLLNTALEIITIGNQAHLSTPAVSSPAPATKAYRAPPNHLLYRSAPHPNIGQMPWPTVDAG
eukprot:scaffold1711_cov60-Attheya_sp.AAC.1